MEVRPGYKPTEIGVLPQDWHAKSIDEIAFVTSGKRLPLGSSLVSHPTPHPYIRVTDMRPGTVSLSEIRYVPEAVFPAIKRYRIYTDDLFISVAGSLGIVGKVPHELDGANLTENADRITNITCSQDFLLHVLMSPLIQSVIDSIQTVGAQPKLALTRIRKFVVPQPPAPEQRAIAAALSDVDALLAGLDRLIAKKRDLKQAAMQQLLTGQTRLPGFEGEWAIKSLGELCSLKSGQAITAEDIDDHSPYRCFGGNGLRGRTCTYTHEGAYALVGRQGALCGNVVGVEGKFFASEHALVVTARFAVSIAWLTFVLGRMNLNQYSESSAQPGLSAAKLLLLDVRTPPSAAEQTAIATILCDIDAELTALEARRAKTRALKQAMMQELLTGKTRLV